MKNATVNLVSRPILRKNLVGDEMEVPVCRLVEDRIVVDVDASVEFHCIATGTPEPQIEWTRPRGVRLPSHVVVDNGYLRIRRVRLEDEGEYVCTALNAAGQAQVTGVLVVREGRFAHYSPVWAPGIWPTPFPYRR